MIYLFDQNEEYIEVIEEDKVREASMVENVGSPNAIYLNLAIGSLPLNTVYLAHKTLNVGNEIELYRIVSIKINNGFVDVEAIQSAYDDLSADGYVNDLRPRNQPVRTVVSSILDGSRWSVGDVYTSGTVTTTLYQLSRLEALQKVLALGFEVKFRIGYRDGEITSRVVDIYSQIGELRDLRYEYGDSLLEIIKEDNRSTIYSAVIGRGRGEEKHDEDGELTGFGRRINFRDVEWRVSNGDPVDKPLGSEMVELPEVTARFGYPDGKPRILLSVFEDVEDPEELLRRSYDQLLASSRPKVTFKTKVRDDGRSGLGDTVQVVRDDLGIRYETRIFEREISLLDPKQVEIKFGDKITQWQTQRIRELKQRLENVSENTINNLQQVEQMIEFATRDFWGEHGYNYDLEADNEYNLPAGLYSFDRPIDQDPTKWVYLGAGKIVVSNSKRADGTWILSTLLDGDGLGTDVVGAKQVQTGSLRTDHILLDSGQSLTTGLATFADTLSTHTTELTDQGLKVTSHEERLEGLDDAINSIELTPGPDGKSSYLHIAYADDESGAGMNTNPAGKKYVGHAVTETQTRPTDPSVFTWSKYVGEDGEKGDKGDQGDQGDQGPQGVKGDKGEDGEPTYTWIRYADNASGVGISNNPTGKLYVGFAYNKPTATESNEPTDYKWSLIKGEKGEQGNQGVDGPKGEDGQPTYTWIKYSANSDGTGLIDTPDANTKYIGIAVNKLTQAESGNKADYTWSKFVGDKGDKGDQGDQGSQGPQGVKGEKGDDGIQRYTWIRYADTATGVGISNDPTGKLYIGFSYNQTTATESNNPSDYKWALIKGEKGDQGVKGEDGDDGQPTYTWIKYSANSNGSGLVDVPNANTKYIGIAVNKTTKDESNTPSDYTWSKFIGDDGAKGDKGDQGIQGIKGADGEDGTERWIWIKYADDKNGTGLTDYPDGKDFIGVSGNQTTPVESDNPADYIWSRINDHSRLDELGQLQEELQQAVQAGGRNLLSGTATDWIELHLTEGDWYYQKRTNYGLEVGETYTFSIEVDKVSEDNARINLHLGTGENTYLKDIVPWRMNDIPMGERVSITRTITEQDVDRGNFLSFRLRNERIETTIRYRMEMLQHGTIATAYSRSPEDIEADIEAAKGQADYAVTRTSEIIDGTIKLTEVEEVKGRTTATESSISTVEGALLTKVEQEDYTTDINGLRNDLDEKIDAEDADEVFSTRHQAWVSQTFDSWSVMVQEVTDLASGHSVSLDDILKYMRFDEDWLQIGASNSTTKVQITDRAINFMENDVIVAYIQGHRLYIRTATILDSIVIGNHVVERHQNSPDITVWRWIGK